MLDKYRIPVAVAVLIFFMMACGASAPDETSVPTEGALFNSTLPAANTGVPTSVVPTGQVVPTSTSGPLFAVTPLPPTPMPVATIAGWETLSQEQLICNGTTNAPPCEDRKIRIRGYSNPISVGAPVVGQSYGWFPKEANIPWIVAVHEGVGPEGFPVGYAFDAGTLMEYVKEDGEYYYVRHPDHLPQFLFTLKKSEVTSAARPAAPFFMKRVPAKWCPAQPEGRWSAKIGETYTWFSIGYRVQFTMLDLFPNAQALMESGRVPDIYKDNGTIVVRQDFEPYTLMGVIDGQGVWLKDANGALFWGPNMYCDYWPDTQP
jgi:hypothetical protein